jgi:hypothetical protein
MRQQWFALEALPCEGDEEWRALPSHGGAYAVSSRGRVARLAPSTRTVPGQILAGSIHKNGYRMMQLTGPRATVPAHQLVWQTFHGDVPAGQRITHKSGDVLDDHLENLALTTYSEQTARLYRDGTLRPWPAGNPRARFTPEMHARILATKDTCTAGQIAAELGISIDAVHSIRQGRYGKHGKAAGNEPTAGAAPKDL